MVEVTGAELATQKPMRKGRRKLDAILDVASQLFLQKGYEQTSIQDIADEVGVLKGSLYYYIEAKEDLLYRVIRTNHEALTESMIEALDEHGLSASEQVERFVTNHMNFVLDNLGRSASFHFEFRSLSQDRQTEIVELRRAYETRLVDLLTQAQHDGSVCPDLDPAIAGRAVLSLLNSAHRWYRTNSRFARDDIAGHYSKMALRSLACDPHIHTSGHLGL